MIGRGLEVGINPSWFSVQLRLCFPQSPWGLGLTYRSGLNPAPFGSLSSKASFLSQGRALNRRGALVGQSPPVQHTLRYAFSQSPWGFDYIVFLS